MVKVNPQLSGEIREVTGKKVKQLRRKGLTPSSVYGQGVTPVSVQFNTKEVTRIFDEVGESGLVDLMVNGEKWPILFKNPQYHPVNEDLMHIDCHKVNLKEKIIATVPVELVGESEAVRAGNVLMAIVDEVEVEALPTNLPEKIEIDISVLKEIEQTITVADLKVDDKVEIKTPAETVLVKIEEPKEEVIEETTVAPEEVPATEQKSPEENGGEEKKED